MSTNSISGQHVERGFELPRDLERVLHERVLSSARARQRTAFRPGVTPAGKAVDVLLQERTSKKIAKALRALQDDYGFDTQHDEAHEHIVHEALQYTNKLEDALQFLALQHLSDALPLALRAAPTGPLATLRTSNDDTDGELAVAKLAKPAVPHPPVASAVVTVADSWDDVDDDAPSLPPAAAPPAADTDDTVEAAATATADAATARSWTHQYLDVIAQREAADAAAAAAYAKLSPDEKFILELEQQWRDLLAAVGAAKQANATKKKQKALGAELQLLKQRLSARGWSESAFFANERAARSESVKDDEDAASKRQQRQRRKQQRDATDEEATEQAAGKTVASVVEEDDDDDAAANGASLFADAFTGDSAIRTAATDASDSAAVDASVPSKSTSKRGKQQPPVAWTGKSPRDHVIEYCKKRKLPLPQYKKLPTRSRALHLYALVIDYKTHKQTFTVQTDDASSTTVSSGFGSIDIAKDTVATHALFALHPDLPLYRVLPPVYRELWVEWVTAREQDAAAALSSTRASVDAIVDRIVATIPSEVKAKASTVAVVAATTTAATTADKQVKMNKSDESEEKEEASAAVGASRVLNDWALDDWDADDDNNDDATPAAADATTADDPQPVVNEEEDPATRAYSLELRDRLLRTRQSRRYQSLVSQRQNLPITSFQAAVIDALDTHDVILISGETGCGKSTQVPQFLLDHALVSQERGASSQIVCTQPRRLAATSLAERVSQELGEPAMGTGDSLVGFQIRLDNRMTPHTKLVFCTTGILLRRLQSPTTLAQEISHIVVDEVHERDLQNDVLLTLLRDFLATSNCNRKRPLKVVLMSATLNAASFQRYFGGEATCPMLTVPGRTFPVTELFLEDALEMTAFEIDDTHPAYVSQDRETHSTQLQVSGRGGQSFTQRVYWEASSASKSGGYGAGTVVTPGSDSAVESYSARTLQTLACIDASIINYELIQELLEHLVTDSELLALDATTRPSASVLVFLPGLQEISTLLDLLGAHRLFADERRFALLPLHSSLGASDQHRIFVMPRGIVRIIATTNIAETSLTIEDAKVVIDTGRVKEMRHNATHRTNVLEEIWISKANAKQRMGRAGRTSGGVCYRLFPRAIFTGGTMAEQPVPEIQRAPLTSLCLQIKSFSNTEEAMSCATFLGACLDPPDVVSVRDALDELFAIGALDQTTETLTTLGRNLAKLPVDVKVGKMLLLGALFDVFDPIATAAAILETKSPFTAPFGHNAAMQAARKQFSVAQSDLLTDVNAYEMWRTRFYRRTSGTRTSNSSSRSSEREFCRTFYLNQRALLEITKLKQQFYTLVAQAGYLPRASGASSSFSGGSSAGSETLTREQTALSAAILFAGLAPNLVHIERTSSTASASASWAIDASKKRLVLRDQDHALVVIHPGSINYKAPTFTSAFLTYAVKLHTSQVYLPTSSVVLPAAMCLFSHSLEVFAQPRSSSNSSSASGAAASATPAPSGVAVRVNDWIVFQSSFRSAAVLQELRSMVTAFIASSMETPQFHASSKDSTAPSSSKATSSTSAQQQRLEQDELKQALRQLFASEFDLHDPKHALTKQLSSARKEPIG